MKENTVNNSILHIGIIMAIIIVLIAFVILVIESDIPLRDNHNKESIEQTILQVELNKLIVDYKDSLSKLETIQNKVNLTINPMVLVSNPPYLRELPNCSNEDCKMVITMEYDPITKINNYWVIHCNKKEKLQIGVMINGGK